MFFKFFVSSLIYLKIVAGFEDKIFCLSEIFYTKRADFVVGLYYNLDKFLCLMTMLYYCLDLLEQPCARDHWQMTN